MQFNAEYSFEWATTVGPWSLHSNVANAKNVTREKPTEWGGGSGFYDTFVDVISIEG